MLSKLHRHDTFLLRLDGRWRSTRFFLPWETLVFETWKLIFLNIVCVWRESIRTVLSTPGSGRWMDWRRLGSIWSILPWLEWIVWTDDREVSSLDSSIAPRLKEKVDGFSGVSHAESVSVLLSSYERVKDVLLSPCRSRHPVPNQTWVWSQYRIDNLL
jgi:hypothetical protein